MRMISSAENRINHKEAGQLNRWTTGRDQPQLNLDEPAEEPQEEGDPDPLEEEKEERIFSGFFAPQAGQVKDSPSSLTFWNLSKITSHF